MPDCEKPHWSCFLNSSLLNFIAWLVLRAEVKVEWLVTKIFLIYLYWCFVSDVVRVDEKLTASRSKNLMFIHGKHEKDVQWCCEGRYKFGRRPSENSRCNNLMNMVGMKELKKCQDTSLEDDHLRTHLPTAPQISNGDICVHTLLAAGVEEF